MALRKIDIGAELGKGWQLFRANMGVLVVAGVIAYIISLLTCGVLGGPLVAGMFLIAQRLLKNDPVKPQAGDVFKGFDVFVQALLVLVFAIVAVCIVGWIPFIGQLIALVVGPIMMWALVFVTYQKLTAIDAIKKVVEHTKNGEFTMPLLFALIANLISMLGALACGIGVFFTLPIGYCMIACCYETLFGDEPEVIDPISIEPPPPLQ